MDKEEIIPRSLEAIYALCKEENDLVSTTMMHHLDSLYDLCYTITILR